MIKLFACLFVCGECGFSPNYFTYFPHLGEILTISYSHHLKWYFTVILFFRRSDMIEAEFPRKTNNVNGFGYDAVKEATQSYFNNPEL